MNKFAAVKKIKELYRGVNSWDLIPGDKIKKLNKDLKKEVIETYGETRPSGVTKIISYLDIDKNDVFFDLGCGGGKVVAQFFYQTLAKSCNGVEYSTTRFNKAMEIKSKIKPIPKRSINFFNQSFLDPTLDLSKGTIFYVANTMFPQKLNKQLWNKICNNKNLKAVIALHGMPSSCDMSRVISEKYFGVSCTWSESPCSIYFFK